MPFGFCNSPAIFERVTDTVLRRLSFEAGLVYLDDIIIMGRKFKDNLKNICKMLEKPKMAIVKLNTLTCNLFRREVDIGHVISAEGVQTDNEKASAVTNWKSHRRCPSITKFSRIEDA